ncbi:uncharacterized protein METZ01_LOCUS295502, partial [marine metagenome]
VSKTSSRKVVARNRKAFHQYEILDTYEAGIVLKGPEVKSLRMGQVAFRDAFAKIEEGQVWLYSLHIAPYAQANRANLDSDRKRKLLLNRSEIRRLSSKTSEKGLTLVPLDVYFRKGNAKLTLGLGKGRQQHDKREKLKRATQDMEARRAVARYK